MTTQAYDTLNYRNIDIERRDKRYTGASASTKTHPGKYGVQLLLVLAANFNLLNGNVFLHMFLAARPRKWSDALKLSESVQCLSRRALFRVSEAVQ